MVFKLKNIKFVVSFLMVFVLFSLFSMFFVSDSAFAAEESTKRPDVIQNKATENYSTVQEKRVREDLDILMAGAQIDDSEKVSFAGIVGGIIQGFVSVLGVALIILMVYAGYLWATAGGNSETVTKSKQMMVNGLIGVVLMLSAYAITDFILESMVGDEARKTEAAPAKLLVAWDEADAEREVEVPSIFSSEYWSGTGMTFESDPGVWPSIGSRLKFWEGDFWDRIGGSISGFMGGVAEYFTGEDE